MAAGYSGTPLARKLGIKPGHRLALLDAPPGFEKTLGPLPDVSIRSDLRGSLDIVLLFVDRLSTLEKRFDVAARRIVSNGAVWIAWPKKTSGRTTDLSFDVVQNVGLGAGLVDNKICAVDDTWSGLRFVIRREDR